MLSAACQALLAFWFQVSLSVIGEQYEDTFSLPTTWQHKSQSLTVFDHLTVTPASVRIKAGGKTNAAGVSVK